MELEQEPDVLTRTIQVLGIFFLGAGFAALLILLTTVMQLMGEPESVFSIQIFTEFVHVSLGLAGCRWLKSDCGIE